MLVQGVVDFIFWFRLMQLGTGLFRFVQISVDWGKVVQNGADCHTLVYIVAD